jgi:glycosyltransferase involved in cell wall biosynthesis
MKTILHVIDSIEPGGAETVFVQLADEFRKRGNRCLVVVSGPGWSFDELERRGFEPIAINAKGTFNIPLLRGLLRIIRDERVDLIQSHLLGSNVYCALAGLIARKPVVATFHGMVDVSPNERLRRAKFWIMNLGVTRFVAVSARLRDAIAEERLLNPRKTSVIYNGVELARYASPAKGDLRSRLGLPAGAIVAASLGNLHPAKGYEYLIRAARLVVERRPEVHFVVGGAIKPQLFEELEAEIARLDISRNVHFVGFVADSPGFLAQADLFILPSISEGFSIVTLEAMASRLPCIITRCGGPEEIVTDGSDARLIFSASEGAICEAVLELLGDASLRERLARCAWQTVEKRFSTESMIAQYQALYDSIAPV